MKSPLQRALNKLIITGQGCWLTSYSFKSTGYVRIEVSHRKVYLHRFMYEAMVGPIPDGLFIDHLCRNPKCCNPDHLEPVTPGENVRRGMAPNILISRSGFCSKGHAMTGENLRIVSGNRRCAACHRDDAYRRFLGLRKKRQEMDDRFLLKTASPDKQKVILHTCLEEGLNNNQIAERFGYRPGGIAHLLMRLGIRRTIGQRNAALANRGGWHAEHRRPFSEDVAA